MPADADDGTPVRPREAAIARAGAFSTQRAYSAAVTCRFMMGGRREAQFAQRPCDRPAVLRKIAGDAVAEGGGGQAQRTFLIVRRGGRERRRQDRRGQRACEHGRLHFHQMSTTLPPFSDGPRSNRGPHFGFT